MQSQAQMSRVPFRSDLPQHIVIHFLQFYLIDSDQFTMSTEHIEELAREWLRIDKVTREEWDTRQVILTSSWHARMKKRMPPYRRW